VNRDQLEQVRKAYELACGSDCRNRTDTDWKALNAAHDLLDAELAKPEQREWEEKVDQMLTVGNHLASVLINRLGASYAKFPPYSTPIKSAQKILSGDDLELWICWRGMMLFRDFIRESRIPAGPWERVK